MLYEVDLVDVARRDRGANGLDGRAVVLLAPRPFPLADLERARRRRGILETPDADGGRRQRTRLGRVGSVRTPEVAGEAVAEIDVRDEPLAAACEEALAAKSGLDLRHRAKLVHGPTLTSRR